MKKLLLFFLCFVCVNTIAQQPFQNKIKTLHRFLEQQHYSPAIWNDTLINNFFDRWINVLDEEKIFFTLEDIKVLSAFKPSLAAEIKGLQPTIFFDASLKLFHKRIAAADSVVKTFGGKPMIFTKAETLHWPQTSFASTTLELNSRWQKYVKWQVLSTIAGSVSDSTDLTKNFSTLVKEKEAEARSSVIRKESKYFVSLSEKESTTILQNAYLDAIAWCFDPHSNYFDMSGRREFDALVTASEYTVGLDLTRGDKNELIIEYLEPGGSAWRTGKLHAGDQILKLKLGAKEYTVEGMEDEEIGKLFNGTENDKISITVKTETGEQKKVDLVFEKITDEESVVKSYIIESTKKIGYINLPGFYSKESDAEGNYDGCANDVSKEIIKLKKDNIAALILDLRDNGGGSVWEAMQLAGIFLDIGPVATIKTKDGKQSILKDPNRGSIYDGPMIVLINGGSASASEFTAAALQDHNRAIIIGETSYGKGTAQVVLPLDTLKASSTKSYENFVKVTNGKFYRINGNTVQWSAVTPDIPVLAPYADSRTREKDIPTALIPDLSKKALYTPLPALPIAALSSKSKLRIQNNDYYKSLIVFNKWIQGFSKGFDISLEQNAYAEQSKLLRTKLKEITEIEEIGMANKVKIGNNTLDTERLTKTGLKEKEINEIQLKELKNDSLIFEAASVFSDWWLLL